jgi:hypothetical protein
MSCDGLKWFDHRSLHPAVALLLDVQYGSQKQMTKVVFMWAAAVPIALLTS